VGRIVEVTVTAVHPREIEVKLADGRPGVIERADVEPELHLSPGDLVAAAVLARDDPRHRVVLSRSWARKQLAWERVEAAKASGETISGAVAKVVKGGLVVDVGVRAFLPASMVDEHPVADLATLVGSTIEVSVVEADRAADRVVVSRRDLLRRRRRDAERNAFAELTIGRRVTARVVGHADYGLQVEVHGVRGLVHRSELSWGRPPRSADVAAVGDEIEAVVIEASRAKHRLGLSIRRLTDDPLAAVEVGSVVPATVTKVLEYGVLARLEGHDIDGLVHMSELTDLPGYRPEEVVTPGEAVVVKVLGVDLDKRRVSLSIRQALLA